MTSRRSEAFTGKMYKKFFKLINNSKVKTKENIIRDGGLQMCFLIRIDLQDFISPFTLERVFHHISKHLDVRQQFFAMLLYSQCLEM